jgi:hypothetical protein
MIEVVADASFASDVETVLYQLETVFVRWLAFHFEREAVESADFFKSTICPRFPIENNSLTSLFENCDLKTE